MKTTYKVLAIVCAILAVILAVLAIYQASTTLAGYACIPMFLSITFFNLFNAQRRRDNFGK